MITIEASMGVTFVGNFPHAGVNNFEGMPKESGLMQNLLPQFKKIMNDKQKKQCKRVFNILCKTSGLNQICRFHCQTNQKRSKIKITHDEIGKSDLV